MPWIVAGTLSLAPFGYLPTERISNGAHNRAHKKQKPRIFRYGADAFISSLTMSYFHTGIRTIIGAESFHCPVRDGKEWDQLAMVIKLKLLCHLLFQEDNGIHREESILIALLLGITSNRILYLVVTKDHYQSYRVKPHEQLVLVSLTHYCASTPSLSTSWSRTTL